MTNDKIRAEILTLDPDADTAGLVKRELLMLLKSLRERPSKKEHPKKEHPKKEHPKKEHPKKEQRSDAQRAEMVVNVGKSFYCQRGQVEAGDPVGPNDVSAGRVFNELLRRKILISLDDYLKATGG